MLVAPETTLVLPTAPTPAVRVGQRIFLPLAPSPWGIGKWLWALPEAELQEQEDAKSSVFCWHAAGTGHCGRERVDLIQGSILIPVCLTLFRKASPPISTRTTLGCSSGDHSMARSPVLGREREKLMHKQTYLSLASTALLTSGLIPAPGHTHTHSSYTGV